LLFRTSVPNRRVGVCMVADSRLVDDLETFARLQKIRNVRLHLQNLVCTFEWFAGLHAYNALTCGNAVQT
jgi:hypothetical protein